MLIQILAKRPRTSMHGLTDMIPESFLEQNLEKMKSGFDLFKLVKTHGFKPDYVKSEYPDKNLSRMWNQVSPIMRYDFGNDLLM